MEETKWYMNRKESVYPVYQNVYQSFHWRSDRARHNILILDVLMADPGEQEWTGVIIISSMVLFSAILRFWQEWRASEATDSLMKW